MTNKIKVTGYTVNPATVNVGTEGSYGIERLLFAFSSDWDGLNKKVTFYPDGSTPVSVPIDNEAINVPCEATARSGNVPYTVCGEAEGKRIYSVEGCLTVLSARTGEGVAPSTQSSGGGSAGYTEINEAVCSTMGGVVPDATWRGKLWSDGSFDIYTHIAFDFSVDASYGNSKGVNEALFGLSTECVALPSAIGEAEAKVIIATENTGYGTKSWDTSNYPNCASTPTTVVFDYRDNLYSGATYSAELFVHVLGKKK